MREEWKDIEGFPKYQVSNKGSVRSFRKSVGKRLRLSDHNGYLRATLGPKDQKRSFRVHRLVASAFLGPCPTGFDCAHLDGDKKNNCVSNLAWVSHKENCSHEIGKRSWAKLTNGQVSQARKLYASGEKVGILANRFGVHQSTMSRLLDKQTWEHIK